MRATERPRHRTVVIDGLDVFYREAGARDRPCVLLLHGFPSSSHSFRQVLSPVGAVSWVVAPDLPGFGFSAAPRVDEYEYTFPNLADVTTERAAASTA